MFAIFQICCLLFSKVFVGILLVFTFIIVYFFLLQLWGSSFFYHNF